MTIGLVTQILQDMIFTTLIVVAPMLTAALVSGLAISIFQAATQINEQTLTFVPKIVLVFMTFGLLFPWIMQKIIDFAERAMAIAASAP